MQQQPQDLGSQLDDYFAGVGAGAGVVTANAPSGQLHTTNPFAMVNSPMERSVSPGYGMIDLLL